MERATHPHKGRQAAQAVSDVRESKIIVLVVNKESGIVQLRYDAPGDIHSHKIDNEPSDQAYIDYYKEKAESLLAKKDTALLLRFPIYEAPRF